jgi:hypothetical protein
MKQVEFEQYIKAVDDFRRSNRDFLTNTFFHPKEISRQLSRKGDILFNAGDRSVLLGIPYHDRYYAIYYYAANQAALIKSVQNLKTFNRRKLPFVCEIIGKEAEVRTLSQTFIDNGFIIRRRLRQLSSLGKNHGALSSEFETTAEFAAESDIPQIMELFFKYFDIYSERIPEEEDLFNCVVNNQTLVIRRDGEVVEFLIFEM